MGAERYANLLNSQGVLTQDLFEKERFCEDLREGDTHHKHLNPYYGKLAQRFDSCVGVGDKIPDLHRQFDGMRENFPGAKFLFMLRDIYPVAQSFEVRSQEAGPGRAWPAYRDGYEAVREWNQSLKDVEDALGADDIRIVDYNRLYRSDDLVHELFGFLWMKPTPGVWKYWEDAKQKRAEIDKKVRDKLTPQHLNFIEQNADFERYQRLLDISQHQAATSRRTKARVD